MRRAELANRLISYMDESLDTLQAELSALRTDLRDANVTLAERNSLIQALERKLMYSTENQA